MSVMSIIGWFIVGFISCALIFYLVYRSANSDDDICCYTCMYAERIPGKSSDDNYRCCRCKNNLVVKADEYCDEWKERNLN